MRESDVTRFEPRRTYALWHDRAVFHFLTDEAGRRQYRETLFGATQAQEPRRYLHVRAGRSHALQWSAHGPLRAQCDSLSSLVLRSSCSVRLWICTQRQQASSRSNSSTRISSGGSRSHGYTSRSGIQSGRPRSARLYVRRTSRNRTCPRFRTRARQRRFRFVIVANWYHSRVTVRKFSMSRIHSP